MLKLQGFFHPLKVSKNARTAVKDTVLLAKKA